MLCLFGILFWLTAVGANYPSEGLSFLFGEIKRSLYRLFEYLSVPAFFTGLLIDGVYTTLSWVVAVMLPPMAIFFPLFSLLEDSGYLPRIAFNLDKFFSKCGAHGKQSLTMAMGIGCNACGVTGCRIIESPRDRMIAVLTNSVMPCNGRFPILIAMIMMFFAGSSFGLAASVKTALILTLIIALCVIVTLLISKLISSTILKGTPSGFALELPSYRKPQILKTIVNSLKDRTLFVLGRAAVVAAPAGAVVLIDHAFAGPRRLVRPLADRPCLILLAPEERARIGRYRAKGFAGYLIKPLRQASVAARVLAVLDGAAAAPHDERAAAARPLGLRVLLAEDNPINALLARTLLEREGCKVDRVADGEQAVAAASAAAYDLILMDLRMPGLSGVEASKALRGRGVATPIAALTADAFDEDKRACLAAGMDDFLVKPLTQEALRAALTRWTGRAASAGWTKAPTRAKVAS